MATACALSVGTMNFGGRTPKAEALRIVARALERGATHFDTANLYSDGESERILGEALRGRRDGVELATKVGLWKREGLSPQRVRQSLEESLRRLGMEHVDLLYLHAPDPKTPIAQTLDAISALVEERRIRAFGVSNFAAWQLLECDLECDRRGLARPRRSQVLYNLLVRQLDVEYFAFTARHPIHTTVYNPLAGGLLARVAEVASVEQLPAGSRFEKNKLYRGRYWSAALLELARRYDALAREAGLSLISLAYGWLAQRRGVDSVLAGPATVAHLDAALDGLATSISPELSAKVDALHRDFLGTDASYAR